MTTISETIAATISGFLINLPWFGIFLLGFLTIKNALDKGADKIVKKIGEGTKEIVKQIPLWIRSYDDIKIKERAIERAHLAMGK